MEQILDTIYQYYPKRLEPVDDNYDKTEEAGLLAKKIEEATTDSRRGAFVECLQNVLPECNIYDRTYFSFAKPCFHFIVYSYIGDTMYEIMIYVSFITPYWGYVLNMKSISGEKELHELQEQHVPDLLKVSRVERDTFLERLASTFYENNPDKKSQSVILEHDKNISMVMDKISECQHKVFGFKILPKDFAKVLVPAIATNLKQNEDVTVFDCLFTDETKY